MVFLEETDPLAVTSAPQEYEDETVTIKGTGEPGAFISVEVKGKPKQELSIHMAIGLLHLKKKRIQVKATTNLT